MKILLSLCVCLFVSSIYAGEISEIASLESLAKQMRRYEILRTETSSDMSQMRNQITGFLHQNHDLIRENQKRILIDQSCEPNEMIVDYQFNPILETLEDQIIRFKTSASSAQTSRADLLHQREIRGEKAVFSLLEPSLKAYHALHVDSTIKQISPLASRPEPKSQISEYYFKKYFTFNSKYHDCDIINLSLGSESSEKTVMNGWSTGTIISIPLKSPYSLAVKSSGNNGYGLTNPLDPDCFLYQILLHEKHKTTNPLEKIMYQALLYMVKDVLNSSMIIVGSIGSGNIPSSFSNFPGNKQELQKNFIWALGSDVVAKVNGKNMRISGTSMAAPSVTGVAALIAGKYPSFSKTDIKECILESARQDFFVENYKARTSIHVSNDFDQISFNYKDKFLEAKEPYNPAVWGKGILDATRALDYAELKTLGKSKDNIVKILNFGEKYKQENVIRRLKKMVNPPQSNSLQGNLLDTSGFDQYGLLTPSLTDTYTIKFLYGVLKSANLEKAQEIFHRSKWMKYTRNEHGQTPLNLAILKGQTELAKTLIENGSEMNVANQNGWTPLFFAALTDNIEIATLILSKDSWLKDYTVRDKRPIDFAKSQEMRDLLNDQTIINNESEN